MVDIFLNCLYFRILPLYVFSKMEMAGKRNRKKKLLRK
jgi:hypothetical protein